MIDRIFDFPGAPSTDVSPNTDSQDNHARQNALAFHVETGDYFSFLATLLGFVEETLNASSGTENLVPIQIEAVKAAREDLRYLNTHYRIEPRSER